MKTSIKTLIALAFLFGSYYLGINHADEKYSSQVKELNKKFSLSQADVVRLKDSINLISRQNIELNRRLADTLRLLSVDKSSRERTEHR